ncbi:hypothetical protein SK128_022239 [Halocaridina rubra]|uniref:Chitin-binding type-2 domain-containing protein n=1 Tax=Halocaridina rubra TaxID=373956 RepID=A0AAN8XRN5_HALRR
MIRDFRFLCPNDTVFDQQSFICTYWKEIDCKRSTLYYSKNDLYRIEEEPVTQEYEYEDPFIAYEYLYDYEESQTKDLPAYVYEYYDMDNDHRFGGGGKTRKGKSQESTTRKSSGQSFSTPKASTTTTSTTTSTTTTTTTTTSTEPTTTTSTTAHTPRISISTPRITTLRPPHLFKIGSPVVSISTSSSTRFETGPSSSSSFPTRSSRFELPSDQNSSTRIVRQEELSFDEEDELYSGAEDPFANYDWRRDNSGVTASTKTRYEQRFRLRDRTRQEYSPYSTASRNQEFTLTTMRNNRDGVGTTTERNRNESNSRTSRGHHSFSSSSGNRYSSPSRDQAHEEFANFRYYKTAFGHTGPASSAQSSSSSSSSSTSSSTSSSSSSSLSNSKPRSSSSSGVRARPVGYISARTASRNTRYAVYG